MALWKGKVRFLKVSGLIQTKELSIYLQSFRNTSLKQARGKGASTLNGYSMLFWQAVIAFEIWNDVKVGKNELDKILKILRENGVLI